jgi:hypothetical protein
MDHRGINIDGRAQVVPDPGPAPMLHWLDLAKLVIDDRYQRPLGASNWAAIARIAADFRWSRFSPVLVAPVAGGLFAVIDGQHRAHAAALCGFTQVPAMVVTVDAGEQAAAFVAVNVQNIRVNLPQIYRAGLAAGEDWAVRAHAAVSAAGCSLLTCNKATSQKEPGELSCIGLIRAQIKAGNDGVVTSALAAVRACPGQGDRVAAYSEFLLKPWILAVGQTHVRAPEVLAAALALRSPFRVIEDAHRANPGLGRAAAVKALMAQIGAALAQTRVGA